MITTKIDVRACGGYLIVTMCGELDAVDAEAVGSVLTSAADGNPRLAVDLTGLKFIDCCALGVLARARAQARRAGGDLVLAAPGPLVRRTLTLAEMSHGFAVSATTAEAVMAAGWAHVQAPAPCA